MNLNQVDFSSETRYEYIDVKSHVSFVTSGGSPNTASITIPHNLGYIPFFRTFFSFPSDNNYYPGFNGPGLLLGNWQINNINADNTNLNISLENFTTSSLVGDIYYRIYAEPQI